MRGRREEHNIIGRGRRVHSFIQNNFVSTKPSVFAPLQTSSCCYCGRGPQWEVMTSTDEKMIPDVMIQSERACSQFPSVYTTRAYVLRLSCDHAGSDPSQHRVKLGYAQTYLDDKRLAMDIHFLLSLCRQSRRFIQSWNISSFRELGQLNQYEDLLCKPKSKEAIVLSSYVVEKFGLCDGLCKTVNDH